MLYDQWNSIGCLIYRIALFFRKLWLRMRVWLINPIHEFLGLILVETLQHHLTK